MLDLDNLREEEKKEKEKEIMLPSLEHLYIYDFLRTILRQCLSNTFVSAKNPNPEILKEEDHQVAFWAGG